MELLNGGGWLKPALFALFFWGLWGFLTKIGAEKVSWQTTMLLFGAFTVLFALLAGPVKLEMNGYMMASIFAGLTGALGFLYFFMALQKGPATVVIPLTSLYVTVSVILAFIFLSEPLTLKKIFGILSAVAAMVLLAG